jgi:arabinose-5-phosphate isomerase
VLEIKMNQPLSQKSHLIEARRVFDLEINALRAVSAQIESTFGEVVDRILLSKGKVVITGLGKSGLVGHKIAATLSSTGTSAVFVNAAEALHGDLGVIMSNDIVIMISNSGNTAELVRMLPTLQARGVTLIGIFGQSNTSLGRACDLVLDTKIPAEACPLTLAPTASSTAALVVGDALACALMNARNFTAEDFAMNHPGGALGRRLLMRVKDVMLRGDDLPILKKENSIRDVAIEMTRTRTGAVCICGEDMQLQGVITEGDLRRYLIESDDLATQADVVMTRKPMSVTPENLLEKVLIEMEKAMRKVYVLPVTDDDNRLVGIVRMHDVISE